MKKIFFVGLLVGLVMAVAGVGLNLLFGVIFPSVKAEYMNASLFRPWSDPLMSLIFVEPFIVGVILAWVWSRVKGLFAEAGPPRLASGEAGAWKRGVKLGLIYWVTTLPGMVMSYSSFPISILMVVTWSLSILVQALLAGAILAKAIK